MIYTEAALADLVRLADFLLASEPAAAGETISLIEEAVQVLHNHCLIGREAEDGMRELMVSRGRSGYVVLYSIEHAAEDVVLLLAIRHQRECGYSRESDP